MDNTVNDPLNQHHSYPVVFLERAFASDDAHEPRVGGGLRVARSLVRVERLQQHRKVLVLGPRRA